MTYQEHVAAILAAYKAGVQCGLAGSPEGTNPHPKTGLPSYIQLHGHWNDGWNDATIALAESKKVIADVLCEQKKTVAKRPPLSRVAIDRLELRRSGR